MGIHQMRSFIGKVSSEGCESIRSRLFQELRLDDIRVLLVDVPNVAMQLYSRSGLDRIHGGQFVQFVQAICAEGVLRASEQAAQSGRGHLRV